MERLIAAGHRRIACLTLPQDMVANTLRTLGYVEAVRAAAIAFDPDLVECCDLSGLKQETQVLWDSIDRMLRMQEPPTVLCCGNDKMALRVYGIPALLRGQGSRRNPGGGL